MKSKNVNSSYRYRLKKKKKKNLSYIPNFRTTVSDLKLQISLPLTVNQSVKAKTMKNFTACTKTERTLSVWLLIHFDIGKVPDSASDCG